MNSDRTEPLVNGETQRGYPTLNETSSNNQAYVPQQNNQGWQGQNQQQGNNYYYNQQGPVPVQNAQNSYQQGQRYNQGPQQNQGYQNNNNNNNNYNNNAPQYGQNNYPGQQPNMAGQMPMPNVNQEKVIIIREHSSLPCRMCGFDGMSTWRQSAGCAAFSWCVCLFCFTGIFGFWIPFCIDSCYDTQILCSRCGHIKANVPADCC